jgi:hypothetical protein
VVKVGSNIFVQLGAPNKSNHWQGRGAQLIRQGVHAVAGAVMQPLADVKLQQVCCAAY